jgi:hypothetical protein
MDDGLSQAFEPLPASLNLAVDFSPSPLERVDRVYVADHACEYGPVAALFLVASAP